MAHLFKDDAFRSLPRTYRTLVVLIGKARAHHEATIGILGLSVIYITLLFKSWFLRSRRLGPTSIEVDVREKVLGDVDTSPHFYLFHSGSKIGGGSALSRLECSYFKTLYEFISLIINPDEATMKFCIQIIL